MASTGTKYNFVIYAPDKTDSEAFARRMSVRETHLARADKLEEEGIMSCIGGAMLTPDSVTGGDRKLIGSVMVMSAEKIEQIKEIVESDIYYTAGVWDPEKIVIAPFLGGAGFKTK